MESIHNGCVNHPHPPVKHVSLRIVINQNAKLRVYATVMEEHVLMGRVCAFQVKFLIQRQENASPPKLLVLS